MNPSSALQVERESSFDSRPFFLPQGLIPMFNFSANHLALLHCQASAKCTVFIMRDHSTHRTYRLYDFSKSFCLQPNRFYTVSGKVNSADKLYLVLESVKPDTKHSWPVPSPLTPDGTGG